MTTPWIHRHTRLGLGLTAVISAVVVAGCGGGQDQPVTTAGPVVRAAADVHYPLDSYQISDADMGTVLAARRVFEIRCMRRLGFTGDEFAGLIAVDYDETTKSQMLTFLDPTAARERGYHKPGDRAPAATGPKGAPEQPGERSAMSGSVQTVNGIPVPQGGCGEEALRNLKEGAGDPPIDVRSLSGDAQEQTLRDPRLHTALQAWSSCMGKAGMDYDAPWSAEEGNGAWQRNRDGWYHNDPTPAEIRTATVDVDCRARTNILGTWIAVQSDYQNQLIHQHQEQLTRAKTCLTRWLATARAAVNSGP
ncbi:hypothetical protein [Actinocrispum wychmicini]|uniref:Uncharacterized protein n=1 Tax=Actinocrispum wychmicini TaxID=1213861 RepID=A0A4R2JBI9_9PSEU|nr:hypothetical protein [Actinocrispum wychmicini]TCO54068.1 hypothetical protein EV192_10948 [Actinocrispum wychmicini]